MEVDNDEDECEQEDVIDLWRIFNHKEVIRVSLENDPEVYLFYGPIWLPVLDYLMKFLSISNEEKDEHATALKETIDLFADSSRSYESFMEVFWQDFVPQVQKYFKVPIKMPSVQLLNRNELLATFLDFLLQIWNYQANRDNDKEYGSEEEDTDESEEEDIDENKVVDESEDGIWNMPALFHNVHNELKYLLTFLGDVPFQICTTPEYLQDHLNNLLAEFEILANQAGHFTFFFILAPHLNRFTESDEAINALMTKVECLYANIKQYCITFSKLIIPIYVTITPKVTRPIDLHFIVNSLLEDLESLINRQFHVTVNVDMEDQISELYEELKLSRIFLKDTKLVSQERENECFIAIRELAYEAEYLINSYVVGILPNWYLRLRLPAVILKLKLNRSRLQKMKSDTDVSLVTKDFSGEVSLEPTETTTPIIEDNLFGIDETKNEILDKLMGCSKALKIVSLIGMPGLGKTSLARSLFDSSSVRNHFDKRAWCVISQNYEKRKMFVDILMDLTGNEENLADIKDEELGEKIHKSLYSRRYLIIIDDIWTSTTWDDIGRYFPDNGNGSRIMLTSRIEDATPIESIFPTLPFLTEVDSMNLLVKKVFLNKPCPLQLLGIGNKIAKRCKGLPLAVVAIAGILSNLDKEESVWEKVEKDLDTIILDDEHSFMKVLDYSYEHLPDHLKLCYLYFGTIPEDAKVSVRKIKRLWIAEGFIRKDEKKTPEDVAKDYLDDLINRSLVLIVKRKFDGSIKSCGIHDSLREMCLKKADERNFMKSIGGGHFSLYMRHHRLRVDDGRGQLSSLSYFGLHCRSFSGHLSVLSSYFPQMPLHRVIDLEDYENTLKGIDMLVYLRYLCAPGRVLSPQSLSNLVNLEVLDVFIGNNGITSSIIFKMTKLRHLNICGDHFVPHSGVRIINDSDRWPITNLDSLSGVRFEELGEEKILKCFPHLRDLKFISCLPYLPDIDFLTKLENLDFQNQFFNMVQKFDSTTLNFPSAIKKLTLIRTDFPWEMMSVIGRLSNLQVLHVSGGAFVGEKWETKDGEFQKLRFLKLEDSFLEQWIMCSEHFPELQCLMFHCCYKVQYIPSDLGTIPTLHTIEVKESSYNLCKSVVHIEAEQHEMGNKELKVEIYGYLSKEKLLSEYKQLEAVFRHYKNENDCIITSKELGAAIKSLTGGYCPIEAELERMLNEVDGMIDFSEFLDLMAKIRVPYSEQELQNAFKLLGECDGSIKAYLLYHKLKNDFGQIVTEEEVEKMVREVDMDGDGKLNYREFKKLMMTINIPRPNDLRNALLMRSTIENDDDDDDDDDYKRTTVTPDVQITHFSHPHRLQLILINQIPSKTYCSGCGHWSSATMYACQPCSFFLHTLCVKLPKLISLPCHKGCNLSFVTAPSYLEGIFKCWECTFCGDGWSYHCDRCEYDLHVSCASKQLKIKHNTCKLNDAIHSEESEVHEEPWPDILKHEFHQHELNLLRGRFYICDRCNEEGEMSYYCKDCDFDLHPKCALEANDDRGMKIGDEEIKSNK